MSSNPTTDEQFKEALFARLHKIEMFISVVKAFAAVFVLVMLPIILAVLAMQSPETPPAIKNDKPAKVKKMKEQEE